MEKPVWLYSFLAAVLSLTSVGLGRAEVKPGDTITKDNLAQAEELLTPATRWMVERGMPMPIIETRKVEWPRAYREATEKYAAQVKIAEDGRDIANYVAGCPFPAIDINDPLAGYKIMWNHEQGPAVIDNAGTTFTAEVVSSQGKSDRTYEMSWRRLVWTGRLYAEPKPVIHEIYDQRGELWKAMLPCVFYTKKPHERYPLKPLPGGKYNSEDEQQFVPSWLLVDLQQGQATIGEAPSSAQKPSDWQNEWYFNEEVSNNTPEVYSTNGLMQSGR